MHNSCSSTDFKSESHQVEWALVFHRQILLVFLPGRGKKPFPTASPIQNSKKLSSLSASQESWPRAWQRRSQFSSTGLSTSPLHPTDPGLPSARRLTPHMSFRLYMSTGLRLGSSVTASPSWQGQSHGPDTHTANQFHLFAAFPISAASHPLENACNWSRGFSEGHENGSVHRHQGSKGKKKEEGETGEKQGERRDQIKAQQLSALLWRASAHYLS